jgi:hypothetical protein
MHRQLLNQRESIGTKCDECNLVVLKRLRKLETEKVVKHCLRVENFLLPGTFIAKSKQIASLSINQGRNNKKEKYSTRIFFPLKSN